MTRGLESLPDDLPVPRDDGACTHLVGMSLPAMALPSTGGAPVELAACGGPWVVVYVYPRTGVPGMPSPEGWDRIPGAKGCTPQSCAFRDQHDDLAALGAEVFGLSSQDSDFQREMAERLHLPFQVLSDHELQFARALRLPTFEIEGMVLIKRLTLIAREGIIEQVFYPVFPPDGNAQQVADWLSRQ